MLVKVKHNCNDRAFRPHQILRVHVYQPESLFYELDGQSIRT